MFDDPSYVNVDKPRLPAAANGNAHRDAFDMSECLCAFLVGNLLCELSPNGLQCKWLDCGENEIKKAICDVCGL